jgi:hypothetical protein
MNETNDFLTLDVTLNLLHFSALYFLASVYWMLLVLVWRNTASESLSQRVYEQVQMPESNYRSLSRR